MRSTTQIEERFDLHMMFTQDLMANPDLAPQLFDPHRTATIEIFAKGTFPDRPPDISTPHTDVYITHWEDKDPNDPFYHDEFEGQPKDADSAGDDETR